jgi:hypothetical protein
VFALRRCVQQRAWVVFIVRCHEQLRLHADELLQTLQVATPYGSHRLLAIRDHVQPVLDSVSSVAGC